MLTWISTQKNFLWETIITKAFGTYLNSFVSLLTSENHRVRNLDFRHPNFFPILIKNRESSTSRVHTSERKCSDRPTKFILVRYIIIENSSVHDTKMIILKSTQTSKSDPLVTCNFSVPRSILVSCGEKFASVSSMICTNEFILRSLKFSGDLDRVGRRKRTLRL